MDLELEDLRRGGNYLEKGEVMAIQALRAQSTLTMRKQCTEQSIRFSELRVDSGPQRCLNVLPPTLSLPLRSIPYNNKIGNGNVKT